MIDFSLTDAQREVQRTARAFAEREILPRIQQMDANAEYDRSLYEKMGAEGLIGLPIPERYGGAGMDYIAFALLCATGLAVELAATILGRFPGGAVGEQVEHRLGRQPSLLAPRKRETRPPPRAARLARSSSSVSRSAR